MTRALGLRYLWIDSLCIHQDSAEDWAAEDSQMDKIYKCAWVTLAATSASSSEDGFLNYLLQDRIFTMCLPSYSSDHSDLTNPNACCIHARYMKQGNSSRFEPDVDNTVWNSRGWTLQERHLSRRTIHFSKSQIFWECRRSVESECGQRTLNLPFSITPAHGADDSPSEGDSSKGSLTEEEGVEYGAYSDEVSDCNLTPTRLSQQQHDYIHGGSRSLPITHAAP